MLRCPFNNLPCENAGNIGCSFRGSMNVRCSLLPEDNSMEEKPKLEEKLTKEPTSKAIKDCTNWLIYCLDIGWQKEQLYYLQNIWWEHHDEKGNLTSTGSVAAPKPDTERIFSGTPEEILDSIKSTGDAYYHHSQLEPVIALLQKEIANHRAINSLLAGDEPEVKLANEVFRLSAEIERLKKELADKTKPFKDYNEFDQEQRGWKPK